MTNIQENKYSMKLALREFLNRNAAITFLLPHFGTTYSSFTDNMDQIQVLRERQFTDKSGIARNKELLRTTLIDKALEISRKTVVYAKMTNNILLLSEVYYPKSGLKKVTESSLMYRATHIYNKANANLGELAAYGVTAGKLAVLKEAIDRFWAAMPKPRLSIAEKKQATSHLAQLFKANDTLLHKLDLLVELVSEDHPDFYSTYWANRKVIPTGKGSLALTAVVTDAATKQRIRGVKVRFSQQNESLNSPAAKAGTDLVKTTKEKGIFKVKSLKPGTYLAVMNKPGFKELTITVTVARGEMTKMIAEMERN